MNFPKVMEMKRKFGTKKQRSVDHESLEDSPAYQVLTSGSAFQLASQCGHCLPVQFRNLTII